MAVALWVVVPIAVVHMMARRWRALLAFQFLVDVALLVFPGRVLLSGAHIGPGYAGGALWGAPTTISGSPEQSDLPLQIAVWWEETRRLVAAGEPPWVSDRIGGGVPLFAHGQTGLPFPLNAPVWFLGAERGTDVMAVWKLELTALGAFLLLRRLRVCQAAAVAGSLAYACSLPMVSWLPVPLSWVLAATPWTWWSLVGCLHGRPRDSAFLAVLLGAVVGWSVNPGAGPFLFLGVALGGLVLAWGRWRRVRRLLVPLILAVAISGIGILSTGAAMGDSIKSEWMTSARRYPDPIASWGLRGRLAALVLAPYREGRPTDGSWQLPFPHAAVAVSAGLGIVLFAFAAMPRRRHRRQALALVVVGAFGSLLLYQVPVFADLAGRLPIMRVMTWARAGFLIPFALTGLGAIGLDSWLRRRRPRRLLVAAAVVQGLEVVLFLTSPVTAVDRLAWLMAGVPVLTAGVLLVPGAAAGWLAAAAVTGESYASHWPLLAVSRTTEQPTALASALRDLIWAQGGRVLGAGAALPANLAARWGAADLRAHDPVRPLALSRLHRALGVTGVDLPGPVTTPWAGLAGAWGVRWLITVPEGLAGPAASGWDEVYRDEDGRIYQNSRALPVVRLASRVVPPKGDPGAGSWENLDFASSAVTGDDVAVSGGGTLRLVEQRPWRVRVATETSAASLLVVQTPRAPGWRASVDRRPVRLVDANLGAMGIEVPAGRHEVTLSYTPPGLPTGVAMTLLGLAGAGWLAKRGRS